jgi:anaerobic selenocysteine-containing dehydrogenase
MAERLHSTCDRGCPDACGLLATVEEGRVTKLAGDPDHPVTRGYLCSQGNRYLERQNAKDRLTSPLLRTGGKWRTASWEAALDVVAEQLLAVRARYGPASVLVVDYGLPGVVAPLLLRRFWTDYGGATFTSGGLSMEACIAAQRLDFGADGTHDPDDLLNAHGVVSWGSNAFVTHPHWAKVIDSARKKGARLVAIDPVRSATAKRADAYYQLRPGSDGMLALGLARLLFERGTVDCPFIQEHAEGFDGYRDLVFSHSLEEVADQTGLTLGRLEELADLYAGAGPVATIIGHGPSYWENGGSQVRLIDALVAVSGNLGVPGGGAITDVAAHPDFRLPHDADGQARFREVLLPRLGVEIRTADEPPLKAAWVAGANPAASVPDTNSVREALRSLEFVVVVEQFMTATAHLADVVLPCATFLEHDDLVTAYGHHFVSLMRTLVPPSGEAKPDVEILQAMAGRLGFGQDLAGAPDEWMNQLLGSLADRGMTLEALRDAPRPDPAAVAVPFADYAFPTASGRLRFVQEFRPIARPTSDLWLLAPKTRRHMNSQVLPDDLPDEAQLRLHPQTAVGLDVAEGEQVTVSSAVGQVRARLSIDRHVHPHVALITSPLWQGDPSGVNQLREAKLVDLGECVAFNETKVTVSPH